MTKIFCMVVFFCYFSLLSQEFQLQGVMEVCIDPQLNNRESLDYEIVKHLKDSVQAQIIDRHVMQVNISGELESSHKLTVFSKLSYNGGEYIISGKIVFSSVQIIKQVLCDESIVGINAKVTSKDTINDNINKEKLYQGAKSIAEKLVEQLFPKFLPILEFTLHTDGNFLIDYEKSRWTRVGSKVFITIKASKNWRDVSKDVNDRDKGYLELILHRNPYLPEVVHNLKGSCQMSLPNKAAHGEPDITMIPQYKQDKIFRFIYDTVDIKKEKNIQVSESAFSGGFVRLFLNIQYECK